MGNNNENKGRLLIATTSSPRQKLTPEQVRLREIKKFKKIIDSWGVGDKTLKKADKTIRALWILASNNRAFPNLYAKCINAFNVLDKWVQNFVAKNPVKAKKFISSYLRNINTNNTYPKTNMTLLPFTFKLFSSSLKTLNEMGLAKIELKPTEVAKLKAFFKNSDWNFKINLSINAVLISNKQNPNIWKAIGFEKIVSILRQNKLNKVFDAISAKYKKERSQEASLKKFEFPKNQRISHIRVFPKRRNVVLAANLQFSALFSQTLKSRYPKMHVQQVLFTNDFKKDLIKRIKMDYDRGVRNFSLDINSHGVKDHFMLGGKPNSKDLIDIIKLFPNAKFTINTMACYGAGIGRDFPKLLKLNPKLKNRVAVFLQTNPRFVNKVFGFKNPNEKNPDQATGIYSTYYYLFLTRALQQGKTYGEAVVEADRLSQKHMYLDPQSIVNGELFVRREERAKKTKRV